MKKQWVLVPVLLLISSLAYGWSSKSSSSSPKSKKVLDEEASKIEVYEGKPNQAYIIVSPIREQSGTGLLTRRSQDSLFKNLKRKAVKLGADAIINLDCGANPQVRVNSYSDQYSGYAHGRSSDVPYCQGTAIKWK